MNLWKFVGVFLLVFLVGALLIYGRALFVGKVIEDVVNLKIELPHEYHSVFPGDKIYFTTKLLNLAHKNRLDVTLKYFIT